MAPPRIRNPEFSVPPEELPQRGWTGRPATPYEALMREGEPQVSDLELLALRDILVDAVERLPDRERWIVLAHVNEAKSFLCIAQELGISKAWSHRCFVRAMRRLQELLSADEAIQQYLTR